MSGTFASRMLGAPVLTITLCSARFAQGESLLPECVIAVGADNTVHRTEIINGEKRGGTWVIVKDGTVALECRVTTKSFTYWIKDPGVYTVYITHRVGSVVRVISNVVSYRIDSYNASNKSPDTETVDRHVDFPCHIYAAHKHYQHPVINRSLVDGEFSEELVWVVQGGGTQWAARSAKRSTQFRYWRKPGEYEVFLAKLVGDKYQRMSNVIQTTAVGNSADSQDE